MAEGVPARLGESPAADRLKEEWEGYLAAQAQRMLDGTGRALGRSVVVLKDVAEGNSPGLKAVALDGARRIVRGRSPVRAAFEVAASRLRDRGLRALRERVRSGASGRRPPTVVLASVDVGVPVKDAYDEWTHHRGVLRFVQGATEEVPDVRIAWTSEGDEAAVRGAVTFHELATDLTRILVTVEYHPHGLRERVGTACGARHRRVRRDLRDYARFLALEEEAPEGPRDELADDGAEESGEPEGFGEPDTDDTYDTYDTYDEAYEEEDVDDFPLDDLPADEEEDEDDEGRGRT
ncbi:cyclase [Streptomyces sp. A1547]|uniref:cyclase n=1 Tax=Streptomyces sp. A1547 TaxID=2563105 RepID=UPI00109E7348|nr:cyclase [Streptomyces sp. A1547]THA39737.1 cyclase [Streptomyces sp. A1547]